MRNLHRLFLFPDVCCWVDAWLYTIVHYYSKSKEPSRNSTITTVHDFGPCKLALRPCIGRRTILLACDLWSGRCSAKRCQIHRSWSHSHAKVPSPSPPNWGICVSCLQFQQIQGPWPSMGSGWSYQFLHPTVTRRLDSYLLYVSSFVLSTYPSHHGTLILYTTLHIPLLFLMSHLQQFEM
jgi:hypothetical protein